MPVAELALLRLKNPTSIPTGLKDAATKQAVYSGYPVTLLHCIEDPALIYLIGGWDSITQHMQEWIPGPINQELMSGLDDDVDVNWMFHVSMGTGEVKRVLERVSVDGKDEDGEGGSGNGVVAVGRYFIKDREGFKGAYEDGLCGLEGQVPGGKGGLVGGWREDVGFEASAEGEGSEIIKDGELNEFVLFTAWSGVQEHLGFAKTEEFKRWAGIKEFMSGAEIRHGRVLFVAES